MAAQRYISTSFWDDAWVQSLAVSEKLVYMYLLTNPLTNIAGVYQITLKRIAFDIGTTEKVIEKSIRSFEKQGKAHYIDNEWIVLPNWPKHQQADKRTKIRAGIDRILTDLPERIWKELLKTGYRYPFLNEIERKYDTNTISIPYAYDSNYIDLDLDLDFDLDLDSDIDSDSDLSETSCPKSGDLDEPYNALSEELKIAEQLAEIIKEFTPTAKVPKSFIKWAEAIERTIRIDGRTPEQIIWLFRWSQDNEFWNRNIRSPDKLREKWDRLVAEAKAEQKKKESPKTGSLKDRMGGTLSAIEEYERLKNERQL